MARDPQELNRRAVELQKVREQATKDWLAGAIPRELPRIGTSPNGAGGLAFLYDRGIEKAEFITVTKPQLERQMAPERGRLLKDRVWACGMLHTAGYQGELAVRLVNNKILAITSRDIRRRLNQAAEQWVAYGGLENLSDDEKKLLQVDKANVRRALMELEGEGRALRTLRDGTPLRSLPREKTKGLQITNILLFFFLRPLPPEPGPVVTGCLPLIAFSSPFKPILDNLKLLGLDLPPERVVSNDSLRAELEEAVADYQKAEREAYDDYQKAKRVVMEKAQKRVLVVAQQQRIDITPDRGLDTGPSINKPPASSSSSPEKAKATTTIPLTEFHQRHIAAWVNAGKKDLPSEEQSAQTLAPLGDRADSFLEEWLTPEKLQRVKHPGVLPRLVQEFLSSKAESEAQFRERKVKEQAIRRRARAEQMARLRRIIDDPKSPEEDKQQARENLRSYEQEQDKDATDAA